MAQLAPVSPTIEIQGLYGDKKAFQDLGQTIFSLVAIEIKGLYIEI